MNIQRTGGSDLFGLPKNINEKSTNAKPAADGSKTDSADAVGKAEIQAFVSQAPKTDAVRSEAVARARQLLAEGKLDTPEAARRAAINLLDLGA